MELLQETYQKLFESLNPNILSLDSVRSVIFLLLLFGGTVWMIKISKRAVSWWIGLILFLEIMHFIAIGTPIGEHVQLLKALFKQDVLSMLAQLCVGTKACTVLLYIRAFLESVITMAVTCIWHAFWLLIRYLKTYTPFLS